MATDLVSDFATYLTELGLDEHCDELLAMARPSVEILTANGRAEKGCSKFGGSPDLPADMPWPQHKRGPYRFLGQINLAEIPKGPHGLPNRDLLSFFVAHDEDGESLWGEPDYVRVYKFNPSDALQSIEPPLAVRRGSTATVTFQLGTDVPPWPWGDAAQAWPVSRFQQDAYWELRGHLHPSGRYLLGYPFNTTLASDPTPGPSWRSLLTLNSDSVLDWCWHDGDWLVTFIEQSRLREGDFSHIKCDAG